MVSMVMDQRAADHDVGQLTHRHRGKFSLQVLYPRYRAYHTRSNLVLQVENVLEGAIEAVSP